jgi:hypothetical protein
MQIAINDGQPENAMSPTNKALLPTSNVTIERRGIEKWVEKYLFLDEVAERND